MATNKKKQDEKHLKMLREMVSFPSNKQCFDCNQRGPTYVNMTTGTFVCTSCSGILRGLHPPHRIKSISMASFTPEEIEFLKCHGNELNKKVYLGLYDNQSGPEPDSRDEQKIRDHMTQKYENKRWYVAPTDAMKEEAKWANEAALNSKPQVKPLRSLLGESSSKLTSTLGHTTPVSHTPVQVSVPLPGSIKSPPPAITQTHVSAIAGASSKTGFDLLGELGGDPFAPSAPSSNGNVDGFADFSNFGNMTSSPSHQPSGTHAHPPVALASQAFPVSGTPLQPSGRGQAPTPTTSQQTPAQSFSFGGDKYAALADLIGTSSTPVTTAASVNWGGSADRGAVNWGGAGGTDRGAINWGASGSPAGTPSQSTGGAINWNSQGQVGVSMATTAPPTGFGAPSAGNPFGGTTSGGFSAFSAAAPSSGNPFGASPAVAQFSQASVPVAGGYGSQFATQGQFGGYGQIPSMQNGGYGMTPTGAGYGVPGSFTQQQFAMPTRTPGAVQQTGGWDQFESSTSSQPVSNPFMNAGTHQVVMPPSGSTNPFL